MLYIGPYIRLHVQYDVWGGRQQVDEDLLERGMLSAPVDPWLGEDDGPCAELGLPWPFGLHYSRMSNDMPEASSRVQKVMDFAPKRYET